MLASPIITNIRSKIDDQDSQEYEDEQIASYINDAIDLVWLQLVMVRNNEVIAKLTITTPSQTLPIDFQAIACREPVSIIGNTIEAYGTLPMSVLYFKSPQHIVDGNSNMPFMNATFNNVVAQVASYILLNKSEFDITQDKMLTDELRKMLI